MLVFTMTLAQHFISVLVKPEPGGASRQEEVCVIRKPQSSRWTWRNSDQFPGVREAGDSTSPAEKTYPMTGLGGWRQRQTGAGG